MFRPTTFGSYFLTRRIAVGGMAEVYAAKRYGADGFEKDVVIKQILPQYARDPEFVASFVAEAKIAVTLSHANIVQIHELGRVDGTYFIAMELVDGVDVYQLVEHCRRTGTKLPVGLALLVVEEVAKGLDYAHRKVAPDGRPLGLVHRDLSPRNVLISREGEVKILDFGIAKTTSEAAQMPKTRAGVVKGTTGYMSPEQATGGDVDARTDVYQAGLLLWELVTLEPLFWRPDDEDTRARMRAHRVPRPSDLDDVLPPELDALVLGALARDPGARIATAHELRTRLAKLRVAVAPDASAAELGALVVDVARRLHADDEAAAQDLPSTQALRDSVPGTQPIATPSIVETLAASGPSAAEPTPTSATQLAEPAPASATHVAEPAPTSATQVAAPAPTSATQVAAPAPTSATQVAAPAPASATQLAEPAPTTVSPAAPRARRRARVALFSIAALVGAAAGVASVLVSPEPPDPEAAALEAQVAALDAIERRRALDERPTGLDPTSDPSTVAADPTSATAVSGAATATGTAALPGAHAATTAASSTRASSPSPDRSRPRATRDGAPAIVSFGTRSCSSRVSVDGVVVARSTPTYDHALEPGAHTITIEGTSCPPIERPGSLRATIPTVVRTLDVPAGARLKLIADFERGVLLVR